MSTMKTVFFERRYNVKIERFATTEEICKFLENHGKQLRVEEVESGGLVSKRGSIYRVEYVDID